jgi:son of sevenless-like protein
MEQKQKNQLRLSLYATDHLMTEPKETDWILQTTEDGSDQYYYNSRTQEMRNSIPPEGFLNQDMQWINANGNPNNSNEMLQHHHHHHHHHQQQQQQHQQPRIMEKPARPVRAANRIIDEQHHQFNTPLSPQSEATFQRSSMDDMVSHTRWINLVWF